MEAETPERQFERQYQEGLVRGQEQSTLDEDADEGIRALAEHRRALADDLWRYEPEDPYAIPLAELRRERR